MLSLRLIVVGKDKDSWVSEQAAHYTKLLKKYARLEIVVIPEARYTKTTDITRAKKTEGEAILARLAGGSVISLDVKGQRFSTEAFAAHLVKLQNRSISAIDFIIGGPFGLDEAVLAKSDLRLSLSDLTLSHQIARLVVLEQLYRALNLNSGGSYHK